MVIDLVDADSDISSADRVRIALEIELELAPECHSKPHPSLPRLPEPKFPLLIANELERLASGDPARKGIDTGRYEALEPPSTDPTSDENRPETVSAWREVLRRAYTSSSYLQSRLSNLALLEEFGKNAWLVANAQSEDVLRGIEKELMETKASADRVNQARKIEQLAAKGELDTLNQSWTDGIGRIIETEVAAERIRLEVLRRRRELDRAPT